MTTRFQQLLPEGVCPNKVDRWINSLTKSQVDALCEYAANSFHHYNKYLRQGRTWLADVDDPLVNKMRVENIARPVAEIENTPPLMCDMPITVRRGAYVPQEYIQAGTWQDPAFVSTTLSNETALYFMSAARMERAIQKHTGEVRLLEITIAPGTPFWPLSCLMDHVADDLSISENEQEILLPPDLNYTITGKSTGGMLYVTAAL